MDIVAFLSCLYTAPSEGFLSVWDLQTSRTKFFDVRAPGAFEQVQDYTAGKVAANCDVYFGVGLRKAALQASQRGTKDDVMSLPALWLDVDIAGPGHKSKKLELPESLEQAISIVELCPLSPSIIVHSGGGLHCYWPLEEPEVIGKETDRYNAAAKRFQKQFIDAAAAKGFHVDQTGNLDRVLRLPGTKNFKSPPARPVDVILYEDVRYSFRSLAGAFRATADVGPRPGDGGDFLGVVKRRLPNLANTGNRDLMLEIVRGRSFAAAGERDSTLQRAASCLAYVLSPKEASGASAAALSVLFETSIAVMAAESDDPDNPALTMSQVVDKISRALDDRARQAARDDEILSVFGATPPPPPSPSPPPGPAAEEVLVAEEPPGYTDEQIEEFAASQRCTLSEFKHRWIIQHASSYYVFSDGKYQIPIGKESLLTHLKKDLAPADKHGVRLWKLTDRGNERAKTLLEVLKDYASGARNLKGSFVLEESFFDAPSETFWEVFCPLRQIEPVYSERIDYWLRVLGGEHTDKLLDWIGTVARLDLQSSALYLSGEAGSGKTMLAHGLSRLWSTGGPALLEDVADTSFNGDIARCPFVFGDEAVKCSTSELRRLVGSSSHKIKRKYLANVDIHGALRIMLADNSGRLIHGHELAQSDVDAVASKFLHIPVGKPPAEYLRSIGGRKGTDGWVDGDKIAAHAIWLALNRDITLGNRLAVEGPNALMAQRLVIQDNVTGVLCEWVAKYLETPIASVMQSHGAVVGGGKIQVAAECVSKFWTSYIPSERTVFSVAKISRALSSISDGKIKTNLRRYHLVKPELIYTWAEENLSCDVDELRRKVNEGLGKN